jgi:hypothetical protein
MVTYIRKIVYLSWSWNQHIGAKILTGYYATRMQLEEENVSLNFSYAVSSSAQA